MERRKRQSRLTNPGSPPSSQFVQKGGTDSSFNRVAQLVQANPLMFLGGLWVSVLLVGTIALSGLLSPGLPGGKRASEASFGSSTVATNGELPKEKPGHRRIPIWLFGAIALSCTAGSIFVSKQLTRTERPHRISRPKQSPSSSNVSARPTAPRKAMKSKRVRAKHTQPKRLKPFSQSDYSLPLPIQSVPQPDYPVATASFQTQLSAVCSSQPLSGSKTPAPKAVTQVPVSIVPPEENHPLDWGEASLADAMDIRKQRSLSSWM